MGRPDEAPDELRVKPAMTWGSAYSALVLVPVPVPAPTALPVASPTDPPAVAGALDDGAVLDALPPGSPSMIGAGRHDPVPFAPIWAAGRGVLLALSRGTMMVVPLSRGSVAVEP